MDYFIRSVFHVDWMDGQTDRKPYEQTDINCMFGQTDEPTDGQPSQAVAIVGWVVLDFYGRMLVSVATNAATILIAHRAPPTPPMPSSLLHEAVILVAAGYQWQQCYQCQSYSNVAQLQLGNANNEEFLLFTLSNGRSVGWIALDRIVLWHCSIAPSLDYFWYFKWCSYVNGGPLSINIHGNVNEHSLGLWESV